MEEDEEEERCLTGEDFLLFPEDLDEWCEELDLGLDLRSFSPPACFFPEALPEFDAEGSASEISE